MPDILYLEPDEEITSVVDKLRGLSSDRVSLVLPKNAQLLGSVVNLKLLQREAKRLGCSIAIVTQDPTGTSLASQLGIPVYASVSDEEPVSLQRRPQPEVGDVIELSTAESGAAEPPEGTVHVSRYDAGGQPIASAGSAEALPHSSGRRDDEPPSRSQRAPQPPNRRRRLVLGSLLLLAILAALGWLLFLYPRATVTLAVASDPVTETVTVVVNNNIHDPDASAAHIPGQKVQVEQEITQELTVTGTKDVGRKATGTVTIKNRLGDPLELPAATKLARAEQEFVTTQAMTVPKATASVDSLGNPVVTPGEASVAVEATQPGDSYNLGPGSFTVTTLAAAKQDRVAVTNQAALSGGESRTVPVMAEDDLEKARQQVIDQKREELKKQVGEQAPHLTILGNTIEVALTDFGSEQSPGAELERFTVRGTIRARTIGFTSADYQAMVVAVVTTRLPDGKELVVTQEDSVETTVKETRYDEGLLTLEGTIRTEMTQTLDQEALTQLILGKTVLEAEALLEASPGIQSASVAVRPAFKKRIPGSRRQVELQLARQ